MGIVDKLQDKSYQIDLVTEFFDGKYTREQVEDFLFTEVDNEGQNIRKGVKVLADEFIDEFGMGKLATDTETDSKVRDWYEATDFYVFDLLPWNTCGSFQDKLQYTKDRLNELESKTIVDYGGGLGIVSIALHETGNFDKIYYVDLKGSVTYGFAEFLINKLGLKDKIIMMGDTEFFESDLFVDCIVSNDCFEHICDLETCIDELVKKTNLIVHDSTFQTDHHTPQHLHSQGMDWFLQLMLDRYFLILNGDPRLLSKIGFKYGFDTGKLDMYHKFQQNPQILNK